MSSELAINLEGISKYYEIFDSPQERLKKILVSKIIKKIDLDGKYKKFWALRDINLSIKKSESVGIIGKNGSGKSTLLQIICGLVNQSSGNIETRGRIAALLELGSGFNPEFTGRENIYLNGSLLGLSRKEINSILDKILDFADIGEFIDQPLKNYSSGMAMRVAFAVQAFVQPNILVVDEALAVGDVFFQQKCFDHIKNNLKGTTKILVTHDLGSLTTLAERVIVLEKGKIIFDGDPHEAIKIYKSNEQERKLFARNSNNKKANDAEIKSTGEFLSLDSKYELKNFINSNNLTGVMDIEITQAAIFFNCMQTDVAYPGDSLEIVFKGKSHRTDFQKIVCGFFFSDKLAQNIFGHNTLIEDNKFIKISENEFLVKINFQWPRIRNGEYLLTIGIGEINPLDIGQHEIKCWANNIISINSISKFPHDSYFTIDKVSYEIFNLK